jgi:hypothetical protein
MAEAHVKSDGMTHVWHAPLRTIPLAAYLAVAAGDACGGVEAAVVHVPRHPTEHPQCALHVVQHLWAVS